MCIRDRSSGISQSSVETKQFNFPGRVSYSQDKRDSQNLQMIRNSSNGKLTFIKSNLKTSKSLPLKRSTIKLRKKTNRPVNVYINNHIMEGQKREQIIKIIDDTQETEKQDYAENNFNPEGWKNKN